MPSSTSFGDSATPDSKTMMPPPIGDAQKAEKYINWIIDLIGKNKLMVSHSDLSKYQPSCLEDHYRVPLKDYEVEVSHSKHPDTSADLFVMLFNNLKFIANNKTEKVILAFIYLTKDHFLKFKEVSDTQIEEIQKVAEERRFKQAMTPIDGLLEEMGTKEAPGLQEAADHMLSQAQATQAAAETPPTDIPAPLENIQPTPENITDLETKPQDASQPSEASEVDTQAATQPEGSTELQPPYTPPVEPIPPQPLTQAAPAPLSSEESVSSVPSTNSASDLPPVAPANLPEVPLDRPAPPDHQSQLAEVAALAAPTPDTSSQNVYLSGDLGYQIPQSPPPAVAAPEPTTPPVAIPVEPAAPIVQNQSSSLFQGGQNENNLFINPAALNPSDIKPINPVPNS